MSQSEGTARWSGLAVGLGIAAVLGVAGIALYLILRGRGQLNAAPQPQQLYGNPFGQVFYPPSVLPEPHHPAGPPPVQTAIPVSYGSVRTVVLEGPNARPRMLLQARRPTRVVLRVLGPECAFVSWSYEMGDLTPVSNGAGALPVGTETTILIGTGQRLYALGSHPTTALTITESVGDLPSQ